MAVSLVMNTLQPSGRSNKMKMECLQRSVAAAKNAKMAKKNSIDAKTTRWQAIFAGVPREQMPWLAQGPQDPGRVLKPRQPAEPPRPIEPLKPVNKPQDHRLNPMPVVDPKAPPQPVPNWNDFVQ